MQDCWLYVLAVLWLASAASNGQLIGMGMCGCLWPLLRGMALVD